MLIYHNSGNASNINTINSKNKRKKYIAKKKKNNYKSVSDRTSEVIHTKVLEQEGQKNFFRSLKKRISKKNAQFQTDLGFKVNQQ